METVSSSTALSTHRLQEVLAPEFAQELRLYGHIYMYRFCPDLEMR